MPMVPLGCWPSWPGLPAWSPALLLAWARCDGKVAPVLFWLKPAMLWYLGSERPPSLYPTSVQKHTAVWRVRARAYGIKAVGVKRSGFQFNSP